MKEQILFIVGNIIKRDPLIELNCFFQDTKIGKRIVDKPYQLLFVPLAWQLYKKWGDRDSRQMKAAEHGLLCWGLVVEVTTDIPILPVWENFQGYLQIKGQIRYPGHTKFCVNNVSVLILFIFLYGDAIKWSRYFAWSLSLRSAGRHRGQFLSFEKHSSKFSFINMRD